MLKQKQQISPDRNEKTNKQEITTERKKNKNIEVQNTIFKNKILNSSLRNPGYSNSKKILNDFQVRSLLELRYNIPFFIILWQESKYNQLYW